MRRRSHLVLLVCAPFIYACSDSPGPQPGVGPLARLTLQGTPQTALAGTALPAPVVIIPQDEAGRTVVNQTATFSIRAGGGSLSSTTGQTNANGTITAPTWTLGKSAVPQEMLADINGTSIVVTATVQTAYSLVVRFFGASVSAPNQALFTSAAARVRGMIVGSLPPVNAANADVSQCTSEEPGTRILNETIAGLLIFASVDSIDGPNLTLAQAGPCFIRISNGVEDYRTVIGIMQFDSADIVSLNTTGRLQEVIVHEMLHVVGLGVYWGPDEKNLLVGSGAPGTGYTGQGGIAGCRSIGGTVTCANSVPVEDCVGLPSGTPCGPGQIESHWKETTFGRELMTPYLFSGGANPLSAMTIRSFEDLGYTANPAAADSYTLAAISSFSLPGEETFPALRSRHWERPLPVAPRALPIVGDNAGRGN